MGEGMLFDYLVMSIERDLSKSAIMYAMGEPTSSVLIPVAGII